MKMLVRGLIVLVLTSGFALSPQVARAETTSSSTATATVEDPSVFDVGGRIRASISQWFGDLVTSALGPVFDLMGRTVFSTPAIAEDQRVKDLWGFSLGIADAALLMFLLAGAAVVTATGGAEIISDHAVACRLEVEGAGGSRIELALVRQSGGGSRSGDPQKAEGILDEAAPQTPGGREPRRPQYPAQSGAQYPAQYPAQWRVRGVEMTEMPGEAE